MSSFLTDQLKSKLQQLNSPKQLGNQSQTNGLRQNQQIVSLGVSNIQRVPSGKINYRDGNTSQSPEDLNSTRGGILQRIQLKNMAFIPAKGQSPINLKKPQVQQVQSYNLTNMNGHHTQNQSDQSFIQFQTKISPQRISPTAIKMIPANQIKLVKKDGTSPSPEGRPPSMKQIVQNQQNQNINPNIFNQNRVSQKIQKPQNNHKITLNQNSDDETNVNSDNEDQVQKISMLKHDTSSNNFNRPKLNGNPGMGQQSQATFTDHQLTQQKTQRGSAVGGNQNHDQQRIKIISSNKIRNSPSPPQNQVQKNRQSPTAPNLQIQNRQQQTQMQSQIQQQQPQQQQPILASDYIKGMINQSRANNTVLNQNNTQKKTIGSGLQTGLTLKKNNIGQGSPTSQQQNFIKDMKKLGLSKDIHEVNQMQIKLSENSPVRIEDKQVQQINQKSPQNQPLIAKIAHIRNYSPPPNFNQVGPNIPIVVKDIAHQDQPKLSQIKASENSPINTSITNEDQQLNQGNQQEGQKDVFQFPFQRRARSLSLPKQEIIQNKMGQKVQVAGEDKDKTSQSPKRGNENQETKRNKPVVANVNFVIAQNGILGKGEEEAVFERNKEVEDWLMGSGESDATAGSNTSNNLTGIPINNRPSLKQNELQKPIQPQKSKINDEDSSSVEAEEEEDWMFRTFDKCKGVKKKEKKLVPNTTREHQQLPGRSRINQINDFEDDFLEESPFDIAPEMQKQFSKVNKNADSSFFLLDQIASDCNDLSQFMEKADQFMLNIQ